MITVRASQLAGMKTQAEVAFAEELRVHLQAFSPALWATLSAPQQRAAVQEGITRAAVYGLDYRGPIRLYLELMLILGAGFDDDPQYPWARETLRGEYINQMYKAGRLEYLANEYVRRIQGPDGAHAQQALYRLETLTARDDLGFRRPNLQRDILFAMDTVFPSKLEAIGIAAGREIIDRAETLAWAVYGEDNPRAVAVMSILMFSFGAHCGEDPVYPWIGATLRDPKIADSRTRADRLERRAIIWLKAVNARARGERRA